MYSIELFTGAGGLALGIHRAGFHHVAVVERDHDACETLRLNHVREAITGINWLIEEMDVACIDYARYPQDIDLLAGGPPCQPFSLGGKHAGAADTRNMFPETVRAVRALRPRAFLLENVRGLLRENFRLYFEYILEQLTLPHITLRPDEGWREHKTRLLTHHAANDINEQQRYSVASQIYNLADFGVPQQRSRVFIVGFRADIGAAWRFPVPTHSEDALLYAQYVDGSYWAEHGLSRPSAPPRLMNRIARLARQPKPRTLRWRTVRDAIRDLPEPINYDPQPPIDNHVGIPDARVYPGHTGSPWDWPAKTIKAGDHGNPGGENMVRHEDGSVRYFTVRELARLQTFPDEWFFANSWTENRRQLGNAVPVSAAEIIARAVYNELLRIDTGEPPPLQDEMTQLALDMVP